MQNKPNFSNNPMNINPVMTSYYKQKTPPGPLPKQTQSNPNKPNPASVFDPKIGFEHTKSVSNGRNCLYFLRIFTKKYTVLDQILSSFEIFFPILCAEFYLIATLQCFRLHKYIMNKSLYPKFLSLCRFILVY